MHPKVVTLQPNDIFDGTTGITFRQDVTAAIDDGADIILVDCQDIKFMDSSGLGSLVLALKAVRATKSQLVLCSLTTQVKTLFHLTEITQIFQIYENRQHFEQSELLKL